MGEGGSFMVFVGGGGAVLPIGGSGLCIKYSPGTELAH